MILIYIAMVALGILLHVAAHKGSLKYDAGTQYTPQIRQSFWMIPVNLTAFLILVTGITLTIYETGRIYGGWE